jgi:hypothetical protein
VVHLGRLKPPRKAAGQMDLLTVPSGDGADMRSRQDVQALSEPPLATAKGLTISDLKGRLEPDGERAKPMASCRTRVGSRPRGSARHLGRVRFAKVLRR